MEAGAMSPLSAGQREHPISDEETGIFREIADIRRAHSTSATVDSAIRGGLSSLHH
jgi:hypothetical protein